MRRFSQLAIPYAVWVALMILLPMLLILLLSLIHISEPTRPY